MLKMYALEKDRTTQHYQAKKAFFTGVLQSSCRGTYPNQDWPAMAFVPTKYQNEDGEFSGEKCWLDFYQSECKILYETYKEHLPVQEQKFMWIGINPDFKSMKDLYTKLKTLPLGNYTATVEGHTEKGYRPHIHMLLITQHKPYRVIEKISKHFSCATNFVEAKNMNKYYEEKMNYLKGIKIDEKKLYVEKDIKERDSSGIPHLVSKP